MLVIFKKVESERLDCGAKCRDKFTERSKEIQRQRAGYQTKNYFRKIAEYRYFSAMD